MTKESLMREGTVWLPRSLSTMSHYFDTIFYVILWGSVFLFLAMFGVSVYFLVKYKRSSTNLKASGQLRHSTLLEVLWSGIPLILLMFIFAWGYDGYLKLVVPPQDAMEIRVTAKKWLWNFDYPGTSISLINELVVPVDTPVKIVMSSEDVIHSFFVPNFRIKKDVIPNRYTRVWFEATEVGTFQLFCTEFCGDGHSNMLADVKVLSQGDYQKWLKNGSSTDAIPLYELGEQLYKSKACFTCHSLDGSDTAGPSWKGIYETDRSFTDGSSTKADDNYLRQSIVNPGSKVLNGFAPVMPTFSGLLSDREIMALIEFIKAQK